ncbi:MAG: outer membrane beta-barrel protein [Proteobacteria bacterium]|jgi:hypothetical protein|nr:outer membrane beta-barrel protein [Pseudomonadota bacterium]
MTSGERIRAALVAAAFAVVALVPEHAGASEWQGLFGVEVGGGYSIASPSKAAVPSSLNGGALRARLTYGLTDAFGLAITGQLAWFEHRRPVSALEYEDETGALVSALGYGDEIARTRLQDLGGSIIYAVDVLRVVPFLAAGIASMRAVEECAGEERVEHDVVLRFEIGADFLALDWFRIGASAVFDMFLTQRADFTAQTTILIRAAVVFDLVGEEPEEERR